MKAKHAHIGLRGNKLLSAAMDVRSMLMSAFAHIRKQKKTMPRYAAFGCMSLFLWMAGPQAFAQTFPYESWMSDTWDTIKDKTLGEIVIPGSHDAGTYDLGLLPAPQVPIWFAAAELLSGGTNGFISAYAETQDETIYNQLKAGARYLDLRFADTLGSFYIHHSLLGPDYTEIFDDVLHFLGEPGHEKEIIILHLSHFSSSSGEDGFDHSGFVDEVYSYFEAYMASNPTNLPPDTAGFHEITPAQLYEDGKQVIVFYDYESDTFSPPPGRDPTLLWDGIEQTWFAEARTTDDHPFGDYPDPSLWASEDALVNDVFLGFDHPDFRKPDPGPYTEGDPRGNGFLLQLSMGPDENMSMFLNTLLNVCDRNEVGWAGVQAAADFTNPRLVPHLIALKPEMVNMVGVDFFGSSGLMEEALILNKNPARVTVLIESVHKGGDCGDATSNDDCDLYPVFTTNGNTSEEPGRAGREDYGIQGNIIPDRNSVERGNGIENDMWTYTTAVPWEKEGLLDIMIFLFDDDMPDALCPVIGGSDDDDVALIQMVFEPGFLENLKSSGIRVAYNFTTTGGIFEEPEVLDTSFGDIVITRIAPATILNWTIEIEPWRVDEDPPVINCAAADGMWHRDNVSIACTAVDDGSGLADSDDAAFSLSTSVPAETETDDASTGTREVCDAAGNCETAGPIGGNMVDRKDPVITCDFSGFSLAIWYADNVSIPCTAVDNGSGLATPSDAAFSLSTSVPEGTETDNAFTGFRQVIDAVGNPAIRENLGPLKIDRKDPVVSCDAADAIWHATDVSIGCTAVDGGSGLATASDAAISLSTSVPEGTETDNAFTGSKEICDAVGNCATAGPIGGNMVDKKAPVITIIEPTAREYTHSEILVLNYTVTDGGSGVATVSPTLNGDTTVAGNGLSSGQEIHPLKELPLGEHTFTVNADDNVGNISAPSSVTFTIIVTPQSIIDAVIQLHECGLIKTQMVNPMLAHLGNAQKLILQGKTKPALNIYRAFINHVQAQTGKKIRLEAAEILIADAEYLVTVHGGKLKKVRFRRILFRTHGLGGPKFWLNGWKNHHSRQIDRAKGN